MPHHSVPVTAQELKKLLKEEPELVVLDTRSTTEFTEGFIPGAVFIGYEGKLADWSLELLRLQDKIVLITPEGCEEEHIALLVAIGFKNIAGFLEGGFEAWKKAGGEMDMIISIDAAELAMDIPFDEHLVLLDVRKPIEFIEGHVEDAVNIPLSDITDPGNLANLEDRHNLYVYCARGYRSVIAASLLKREGYNNLRNITGGWEDIRHTKGISIVKETSALN